MVERARRAPPARTSGSVAVATPHHLIEDLLVPAVSSAELWPETGEIGAIWWAQTDRTGAVYDLDPRLLSGTGRVGRGI